MTSTEERVTVRAFRTPDGVEFDCGSCGRKNRKVTDGSPAGCEVVEAGCDNCGLVNHAVLRRAVFA